MFMGVPVLTIKQLSILVNIVQRGKEKRLTKINIMNCVNHCTDLVQFLISNIIIIIQFLLSF